MVITISLVFLLSPCLASTITYPTEDCNSLQVKTGATWLDMTWSLYCGLTDPTSAKVYIISITDMSSFTFNETLTTFCPMMNCSMSIPGLHPCITYQISMLLQLINGSSYTYLPATAITEEIKPGKPRDIKQDEATETSMTVSWSPPGDGICVHSYLVCTHMLYSSNTSIAQCFNTAAVSTTISSLLPCMQYMVEVIPRTAGGLSGGRAVLTAGTQMKQPDKPGHVQSDPFLDSGYDYVDLTWSEPSSNPQCVTGTGVGCRRSDSQSPAQCTGGGRRGDGPFTSTVVGLRECTVYDCWVQFAGISPTYSDTVQTCTGVRGVTISPPTRMISQPGVTDITLIWSPPVQSHTCVDQYALLWQTENEESSKTEILLPGESSEYRLEHLEPCTPYTLSLTPVSIHWGKHQNGSMATISEDTLPTTPGPVQDIIQVNCTQTSVTIEWSYPAFAARCVTSFNLMVEGGDLAGDCRGGMATLQTRRVIDCLMCGNTYMVTVWAVGRDGVEGEGVELEVWTEEC